jgi:hypothetical protein
MGKFIWFTICLLASIFLVGLSLISDKLVCSGNYCQLQSKIDYLNYVISEDNFHINDISSLSCQSKSQPARRGKQIYYVLELNKTDGTIYYLGSYKKYKNCKNELTPIRNFLNKKNTNVIFNSNKGFTNSMGFVLAFILLLVGYIILTTKESVKTYDFDDDDIDSQNNDQNSIKGN